MAPRPGSTCDTAVVDLGRAPRDLLARMLPGAEVTAVGLGRGRPPPAAGAGRRRGLPVHGNDGRGPRGGVGEGLPGPRAAEAGQLGRARAVPGWCLPAARPSVHRGSDGLGAGALHGPAGRPPDHPGRGGRRRRDRCLPADAAPRRAPRAGRPDGSVRRLVAAVALRRRRRRVLGGPRGRLDRRRLDARQAHRQRAGRRRGAGADLSLPRRGHQGRPVAVRAAAQRARPRDGRRDDPARRGDAVHPDVHLRRRGQRRDVAPRLDRHVGPPRPRHGPDDVPRRDQRDGAAREGAARSPGPGGGAALPRPCRRGDRGRALPRDAAVVHRRGRVRAPSPARPLGRAVARAPGRGRRPWHPAPRAPGACSGCGSRRAT